MTLTVVDCLRHGEVAGGRCFRGRTDEPLTANGWRQMRQQCRAGEWEAIISSPLIRCHGFAEQWAGNHNLPLLVDSDWAEIDFGDWDGQTAEQIEQRFPGQISAYYRDPLALTPPNAETYQAFSNRVLAAWQRSLENFRGKRLLVVTHGGPIRSLFSSLLQIPVTNSLQIDVPHACLTRFSYFQGRDEGYAQLNFHKPL